MITYRASVTLRLGLWLLLVLATLYIQEHTALLISVFLSISAFSIVAGELRLVLCAMSILLIAAPPMRASISVGHALLIALCVICGILLAGINLAFNPTIEFAVPDQRSLHIGLGNTITGVVILLKGLVGVVVDHNGYAVLFAFYRCAFLPGLAVYARMRDLRMITMVAGVL